MLFALPLVALPVLIHLINQRRYRTVPWGPMTFLLKANRMSQSFANLKHIITMLVRMLAIAALLIGMGRPLMRGWLAGVSGNDRGTIFILLDRSSSMEQQNLQTGKSKRSDALLKLAGMLDSIESKSRIVLIESAGLKAREIVSTEALATLPGASATSTSADIPAMLEAAADYIAHNKTGQSDIWICSDQRINDWDPESIRWKQIRSRLAELKGIRIHLLAYPDMASDNLAVRVGDVRVRETAAQRALSLDVHIERESENDEPVSIPLEFVVNGARSVVNAPVTDDAFAIRGHTIALDESATNGWGKVVIPNDSNPEDNEFYFVYADNPVRRSVVVSADPAVYKPLVAALNTPPEEGLLCETELVHPDDVGVIDWNKAGLVVWHAPLPDESIARHLHSYVESGKTVLFFPPANPGKNEAFGVRWGGWKSCLGRQSPEGLSIETWENSAGLLGRTLNGADLPVKDLHIRQCCEIRGEAFPVAQLSDGTTLFGHMSTEQGAVYFLGTLPHASHSNLLRKGVTFYVMLQRALAQGSEALSSARHVTARLDTLPKGADWIPEDQDGDETLSIDKELKANVYRADNRFIAVNRPTVEDMAAVLDSERVSRLFDGLDFKHIVDNVDSSNPLASEIWRLFLILVLVALIGEALLCLQPRRELKARSLREIVASGTVE